MVPVGLEPTVSLRSVRFAIVACSRWRSARSFAHHAYASLHRPQGALGSAPIDVRSHLSDHWCEYNRTIKKENHPLRVVFFLGGASWTRTNDPIDVNDVLYRLSHGTKAWNRMYYITVMGLCQPPK